MKRSPSLPKRQAGSLSHHKSSRSPKSGKTWPNMSTETQSEFERRRLQLGELQSLIIGHNDFTNRKATLYEKRAYEAKHNMPMSSKLLPKAGQYLEERITGLREGYCLLEQLTKLRDRTHYLCILFKYVGLDILRILKRTHNALPGCQNLYRDENLSSPVTFRLSIWRAPPTEASLMQYIMRLHREVDKLLTAIYSHASMKRQLQKENKKEKETEEDVTTKSDPSLHRRLTKGASNTGKGRNFRHVESRYNRTKSTSPEKSDNVNNSSNINDRIIESKPCNCQEIDEVAKSNLEYKIYYEGSNSGEKKKKKRGRPSTGHPRKTHPSKTPEPDDSPKPGTPMPTVSFTISKSDSLTELCTDDAKTEDIAFSEMSLETHEVEDEQDLNDELHEITEEPLVSREVPIQSGRTVYPACIQRYVRFKCGSDNRYFDLPAEDCSNHSPSRPKIIRHAKLSMVASGVTKDKESFHGAQSSPARLSVPQKPTRKVRRRIEFDDLGSGDRGMKLKEIDVVKINHLDSGARERKYKEVDIIKPINPLKTKSTRDTPTMAAVYDREM